MFKTLAPLLFCWIAAFEAGHAYLQADSPPAVAGLAAHEQTVSLYGQASATVPSPASSHRAVVDRYCVTCHNARVKTAGLLLDEANIEDVARDAEVWEKVVRRLRRGTMPPPGRPRPDAATYEAVASWLETEIDRAASDRPNPGRTNAVHRLNRTEYHNAIRDLLAVDIDVEALLPGDDTSDSGFDNNADVLSISTSQLERYLAVARRVTRLATGVAPSTAGIETFAVPLLLVQDDRQSEELPFGSRGGIAIRYHFPVDGEYVIKVHLRKNYMDYIMGMGTRHQLDISIDDELVKRFSVGGEAPGRAAPASFTGTEFGDPEWEDYMRDADKGLDVRLPVKAGRRLVTVSFVRKMRALEGIPQPRQRGRVLRADEIYTGNAGVGAVDIGGPYGMTDPGDTPSRREIFVCQPQPGAHTAEETACATQILSRLARRAYRRPVLEREVDMLLGFFVTGRKEGGSFDAGIQVALERLLIDPNFLLRVYRVPANAAPGHAYRLNDVEVASRLSFFLWSSIPDETLLDLAERGTLTDPPVLEQQVRRMLADARAATLVDDFAAQWLHLRKVPDVLAEPEIFPNYDDNLIHAFKRETELFIASTLREDRSVLDLLRADYTFVDERLARHYGIPGVYGSRFRRVTVPNTQQRGGILAHGGLLAMSSYPNRTSPVLRGKWLLDTILGAPPPSPPANVPPLREEPFTGGRTVSVRERLEQHRNNPVCASCHQTIDPLGFALENYDSLGAWRTVDEGGNPVDASGTMPNGARVEGLAGLRALLLSQPKQFVGTVTEKLLAYALGRAVEYYDQPTMRKIVGDASIDEYRWSSLILGIVKSPAFLMRNAQEAD